MTTIGRDRWNAIGPHLDALLDLDGAARARRLDELRASDADLADEIAALLAGEAAIEQQRFLEGSPLGDPEAVAGSLAGRQIGAYTLERPLGEGGMGSVWLARRSDGRFEGTAAVKFLNLALLTRGGPERFTREGSALARLAHPNIARLLDAGVTDGGTPYLVLEYVDGKPIDAWCDARALDVRARIRLFLDVLRAVSHAHERLILHRDLKPSNILVTADGQVKLLDFGIAKLLDESAAGSPSAELTQFAGRAFTPEFAAPEQVQGEEASMATDVYALGVLLYLLLTGKHPTGRDARTPVERLQAVVDTVPSRVSQVAAPTRKGELRGDLDVIVAKALHKRPDGRYPTAAAFSDDLSRYLRSEPIAARPDSRGYRLRKFLERHRVGMAAASLTVAVLIAGIVGTTWQAIEARRERDRAIFEAERALAKGSLFNLLLGAIGGAGEPLTPQEILRRSVALVEKQYANDPRLAIDLLLPIAGHYVSIHDAAGDLAVMRRAGELAAASGDAALIANVACDTVESELSRGRVDLAQAELDKGLAALATAAEPDFRSRAACWFAEAELARRRGDFDRARERLALAIRRGEAEGQTRGNVYPKLVATLADLERRQANFKASHDLLKRKQALHEAGGTTGTVEYLGTRRDEAMILIAWGEYRSARSILEDIDVRWRVVTGDEATPPWLDFSRGRIAQQYDELDAAQRILADAASRSRKRNAVEAALGIELWLAQLHVQRGEFEDAERVLARQEEIAPSAGRFPMLTPATIRASAQRGRGALSEAAATIAADVNALRSSPSQAVALAAALREAARIALAANEAAQALRHADEALAVSQRGARDAAVSASVGEALLLRAQAQRTLGDLAGAAQSASQAARALAAGLSDDHRLTKEALALAGSSRP